MKIFSDTFKIIKNEDGSFNLSTSLTEELVIIKVITRAEVEQLFVDIENVLK